MAKTKYESQVAPYLEKIVAWAEAGATAKDIAAKLRLADSTFRRYIDLGSKGDERYAALSAAFTRACEVPDDTVEAALYKKTQGYNAVVVKHYKLKRVEYDPDTGRKLAETEELVAAQDEVHVPADVTAQMFWLTNRRRERWQYRPDGGGAGDGEGGVIVLAEVAQGEQPRGVGRPEGKLPVAARSGGSGCADAPGDGKGGEGTEDG